MSATPDTPARRQTVATYTDYARAERAVDHLSDEGFPVEDVRIVGTGLRMVEQVAGRVTTGRAALSGAGQGAFLGALFALFFGLFFTLDDGSYLGFVVYAVILGALIGAAIGALAHAATGGRRDFDSARGLEAAEYEIQVLEESAGRARELLDSAGGRLDRSQDRAPQQA